jgi:hypothetical protein
MSRIRPVRRARRRAAPDLGRQPTWGASRPATPADLGRQPTWAVTGPGGHWTGGHRTGRDRQGQFTHWSVPSTKI